MVHPSWVQTPSIAENVLAPVRDMRNTPAVDSTTTAPPTSASADPVVVTCTVEPMNRPARTLSFEAMPLGDVGDPPPQAEASVASVAQEATWQASAQNRRRETDVFVFGIGVILVRAASAAWKRAARSRPPPNDAVFLKQDARRVPADHRLGVMIS
jgi:hypothetical protein